ncbi:MAG: hypothetical protein ACLR6B_14680 [Blautia sp.]
MQTILSQAISALLCLFLYHEEDGASLAEKAKPGDKWKRDGRASPHGNSHWAAVFYHSHRKYGHAIGQ